MSKQHDVAPTCTGSRPIEEIYRTPAAGALCSFRAPSSGEQRAAELANKRDRDPQFRTVSTIVVTVMLATFYPASLIVAANFAYQLAMLFAAAFGSDATFEYRKARIRACAHRIFSFGYARNS